MTIGYVSRPRNWVKIVVISTLAICGAVVGIALYERLPHLRAEWQQMSLEKSYQEALEQIKNDNHIEAREILNRIINTDPQHIAAWRLLAQSWDTQNYPDAWWAFTRTATLDKTDVESARAALRSIISHRQFLLGEVVAIDMLRHHPGDITTIKLAARILSENQRYLDAYTLLNSALSISPDNKNILKEQTALIARGISPQSNLARADLAAKLESVFDTQELSWLLEANAIASLSPSSPPQKRTEAINLLEKAIQLNPQDWALRMRWFSLLREYAPEKVRREIDDLWNKASESGKPGRQLSTIRMIIDLPGTALAFIRQLPQRVRTAPETAILEIQALHGTGNWVEIQNITNLQVNSETINPYHKLLFQLWAARAAQALNPRSQQSQSIIDQARALATTQNDPLLSLTAATLLNQWLMPDQALPFLNLAALGKGEVRATALRGLSSLSDKIEPKRRIAILVDLHNIYPEDAGVAAQAANVFLEERFNLPTALTLAEIAYRHDPTHIPYADVYARALAANNRRAEGLSIYQSMPPAAFDNPDIRRNMQMLQASGVFSAIPATLSREQRSNDISIGSEEIVAVEEVRKMLRSNPSEALPLARRLYNLYPNNILVITSYAMALVANDQCEQALQLYSPSVQVLLPDNPSITLDFAQILMQCREPGRCLEILDTLDPQSLNADEQLRYGKLHSAAQNSLLSQR